MDSAKLLLVEDDKSLGATLCERLQKEGYLTRWVRTIQDAKSEITKDSPDLMILDLGLPDGSGFSLAEELSKLNHAPPFLILTALSGAPERLQGFELGAEEFIPKPFHLKELLLRVKHVLDSHRYLHDARIYKKVNFMNCAIDFESMTISSSKNGTIQLSMKDNAVLQLLYNERHRVVSRDEILDKVWGEESFPTNRTVDNCIVRLRQALGENATNAIRSIRGVGYRWIGEQG